MRKNFKIMFIQGKSRYEQHAPPLGLGYLAAVAEQKGWEVKIIDNIARFADYTDDQILKEAQLYQPDIICIPINISTIKSSYALVKKLSSLNTLLISGGPHPTLFPDEAIKSGFHAIVMGEGEITLSEIFDAVEQNNSLHNILGISFKENGKIVHNPPRPFIKNLDDIPFPALHLFQTGDYAKNPEQFKLFQGVVTSRGCPYECSFCTIPQASNRKYRYRSIENVVEGIKQLKEKWGVSYIIFYDELFTVNKKRTMELCDAFINSGLNIKWNCTTRVDLVDHELLLKMKNAGCDYVAFGIESPINLHLKKLRKELILLKLNQYLLMHKI